MSADILVCTIVLAFGSDTELLACLGSLRQQVGIRQKIVVIQNGAAESLMDLVVQIFPEVELVRNGANVGASTGRNVGMQYALKYAPAYIFFADNDATFAPDALQELVRASQENPRAGILGAVVYRRGDMGKIFSAGAFFRPPFHDDHLLEVDSTKPTICVDFIGTGAMLVPSSAAKQIGNFDDALFVYFEDADWCLRARQIGLQVLVVTRAHAYHDVSRGKFTPSHVYYTMRNRLVVSRRHGLFTSIMERSLWSSIADRGVRMMLANDDLALTCSIAYWTAVGHYLCGRLGSCPRWMNHTRDGFFEAGFRKWLRETAAWTIMRRVCRALSS